MLKYDIKREQKSMYDKLDENSKETMPTYLWEELLSPWDKRNILYSICGGLAEKLKRIVKIYTALFRES